MQDSSEQQSIFEKTNRKMSDGQKEIEQKPDGLPQHSDTNQTLDNLNANKVHPFTRLQQVFQQINMQNQLRLPQLIRQYAMLMIKNQEDDNFFQHFVEKKYVKLLKDLIILTKCSSDIVRAVFQSLQILLKGLKKQDQFVYFMVSISRDGFIDDNYQFVEEDAAYFANFLKILARKINQDQKYLAVFLNAKEPDFPLLKNLLRFHDSPDVILHTSAKLTIMELCRNKNGNSMLETYIKNFPFVIFYPCYTYPALQAFEKMIESQQKQKFGQAEFHQETLRNHLKFMEDFISARDDKYFIHMYVNTFFALIGRKIYRMIQQKNSPHLVLKAISEIFIKQVSVHKIKMGLQIILQKFMSQTIQKYFKYKTNHLDKNYWLLTQCQDSVKEHCRSIFHNDVNMGKLSFIKTVNSYIPKSRSNWFYKQIDKISEIIGINIEVNIPIDHQNQNQKSFIKAMDSDIQEKMLLNPIYQILVKNDKESEQTLFWYLKISRQIDIAVIIEDIIGQIKICTSLCLVKAFYEYVISKDLRILQEHAILKKMYQEIIQKLTFFILNQGWNTFLHRAKVALLCLNGVATTDQWSHDFFRDIQCEIVLFIAIRHLFGTSNQICEQISEQAQKMCEKGRISKIQVNCKLVNSEGQNCKAIMQGQYLKVSKENDDLITKEPLILSQFKFYKNQEDKKGNCLTLVQKMSNNSFTICFADESMLEYMIREFKQRRDLHLQVETQLKTLKFPDKQ